MMKVSVKNFVKTIFFCTNSKINYTILSVQLELKLVINSNYYLKKIKTIIFILMQLFYFVFYKQVKLK